MRVFINIVLLLVVSLGFALGYFWVKLLEGVFPPLMIAAGRGTLGAAAILLFCVATRQPLRPVFRALGRMALLALVGPVFAWSGVALSERRIDSDLATLLVCIVPISTMIVSALPPLSRKMWWPVWIGAPVGVAGLVLAIGPAQLVDQRTTALGVGFIAGGFFSYALYCVLSEQFMRGLAPSAAAGVTMLYGAVMLWPLTFAFESPLAVTPRPVDWLHMTGLGLFASALPVLVLFIMLKRTGAVFVSLYGYLAPIWGILLSAAFLNKDPSRGFYLGATIAFAGVALLQWAQQRSRPDAPNLIVSDRADPRHLY